MTKINLGDFKVDDLNQDEVISEIKKNLLNSVAPHILVTPNAGHLKSVNTEIELRNIYSSADLPF
jgi:UDP-N-acetyl-D-mannosaminuronic acid transferase (WecB/TagA/CpsF family)